MKDDRIDLPEISVSAPPQGYTATGEDAGQRCWSWKCILIIAGIIILGVVGVILYFVIKSKMNNNSSGGGNAEPEKLDFGAPYHALVYKGNFAEKAVGFGLQVPLEAKYNITFACLLSTSVSPIVYYLVIQNVTNEVKEEISGNMTIEGYFGGTLRALSLNSTFNTPSDATKEMPIFRITYKPSKMEISYPVNVKSEFAQLGEQMAVDLTKTFIEHYRDPTKLNETSWTNSTDIIQANDTITFNVEKNISLNLLEYNNNHTLTISNLNAFFNDINQTKTEILLSPATCFDKSAQQVAKYMIRPVLYAPYTVDQHKEPLSSASNYGFTYFHENYDSMLVLGNSSSIKIFPLGILPNRVRSQVIVNMVTFRINRTSTNLVSEWPIVVNSSLEAFLTQTGEVNMYYTVGTRYEVGVLYRFTINANISSGYTFREGEKRVTTTDFNADPPYAVYQGYMKEYNVTTKGVDCKGEMCWNLLNKEIRKEIQTEYSGNSLGEKTKITRISPN